MPTERIATGSERLDQSLQSLIAILGSNRLNEVKSEFGKTAKALEQFFGVLGDDQLLAAYTLLSQTGFADVLSHAPAEHHEALTQARERVEKELGDILRNPFVRAKAQSAIKPAPDLSRRVLDPVQKAHHAIGGIAYAHSWAGSAPELSPVTRLLFLDKDKDVLLDSTLDLQEVLFAGKSLVAIAVDALKDGSELQKHGLLKLPEKKSISEGLRELEKNLVTLQELIEAQYAPPSSAGLAPPATGS